MAKEFAPLTLSDKMPFGRSKGTLLGTLVEQDPDYCRWLLGTDVKIAQEVVDYLEQCSKDDYDPFKE